MRFIKLNEDNKVIAIRIANDIVEGEMESNLGEIGETMQSDGTFIGEVAPTTIYTNEPTNAEIAQMLSDLQADLIIAGVI